MVKTKLPAFIIEPKNWKKGEFGILYKVADSATRVFIQATKKQNKGEIC